MKREILFRGKRVDNGEAEYIEREDALKAATLAELDAEFVIEALHRIPAADVRPVVKAEWLPFGKRGIYGMMYACSSCRAKYDGKTNFCPNCGADMRETCGSDSCPIHFKDENRTD